MGLAQRPCETVISGREGGQVPSDFCLQSPGTSDNPIPARRGALDPQSLFNYPVWAALPRHSQ